MKRAITLIVAMMVLAGCNTVAGVGKDVEKAGEAIQKSTK
jgi:entericidin B